MIQKKKILLLFFFLLNLQIAVFSQIKDIGLPFITNYSKTVYQAGTQNWAILQDNRDFIYVANNNAILIFDGKKWQQVSIANQGEVRSLCLDNDGRVWVGGFNEIGYLTIDSTQKIVYKSIIDKIPQEYRYFNQAWNIYNYKQSLVVETQNELFFISNNNFKAFHSKNGYHCSFKVNNDIYVREWNTGLLKYKEDTLILVPDGDKYFNDKIYSILPLNSKGDLLVASRNAGLSSYNGKTFEPWGNPYLNNFIIDAQIYCGIKITSDYFAYGTLNNGIIVIDTKGNLIQHINAQKGLIDNVVYNLYLDNFNDLWAATGNGISQIEIMSPYTQLNTYHGINSKVSLIEYLNGILYCGGDQNLFYCDWLKFNNYDDKNSFRIIENTTNQSWLSTIINSKIYIGHNPGLLIIDGKKAENQLIYQNETVWGVLKIPDTENLYIGGTNNGFILLKYDKKFSLISKISGFEHITRFFDFDKFSNLWVSIPTEGVFKLNFNQNYDSINSVEFYGENKGLPSDYHNFTYKLNNNLFFFTDKQIYSYNYNLDTMVKNDTLGINKLINQVSAVLGSDSLGNIWFLDDTSYAYMSFENNKTLINRTLAYKLTGKGITSFYALDKKNIFFGYSDGVLHIDPTIQNNYKQRFNTYIQSVELIANDSLIFGGNFVNQDSIFTNLQPENEIIYLDAKNNSLRFKVSAGFYKDIDKIQYKYMLEGFDENWSNWSTENTKEYTNLQSGEYNFRVIALNSFNVEGNEIYYKFFIKVPWYKTIPAFIAYFFLLLLFFFSIIKIYTFRLNKQNFKLEQKIIERTNEIQLQKTELEMQKEEIQTQTEELEKINKELAQLSIVASETDNAILIMDADGNFEWVNPAYTKIFGYSVEELVNEVSRNIIGKNTTEDIRLLIRDCIETKKTIKYELKTVNKFGQEIWIHSTLTPVLDHEGNIKNLIAIDSDITKQKEAEEKIQIQNENIKGSIKYALTIQKTILPSIEDIEKHFDIFIIYRPKDIVSGDFYWHSEIVTNIGKSISSFHFFVVVDCTGHGVPGAFMSLIASRLLHEVINEQNIYSPKRILEQLDAGVKKVLKQEENENNDGMDISICRFEKTEIDNIPQTKVIYSGAKTSIMYYLSEKDKIFKTKASRSTIGGKSNISNDFTNTEIVLYKDDFIFMFSDGIKDQNNPERKKFGTTKTINVLQDNIKEPVEKIKSELEKTIDNWQQDEDQRDDITFIGLKIR